MGEPGPGWAAGSEQGLQRQEDKRCIECGFLLPFSAVQLCPSPAGSWGGLPSPPSPPSPPGGSAHKAWQLSMLPVLSALTKCFIPAAARPSGAVTQQQHPHRAQSRK